MNQKISHVMTIANSIIGVGILAMPYCFKQCGIILSICILLASSTVSRLSCHLLLKSAIIARRKTFENLAFHAFGSLGKFIIEVGMIGFLLGTCIAFFVVMGDLGPAIIAKISGTHTTDTLRTSTLMALALFCVLPLGLLRNVDSLTSVCTASVGFYFCLVLKIITEAGPHIYSGDWTTKVVLWRPAGILQCLPIFSMALFCQTQIFEIYQAIPNASLDKMNELIRAAVNICTGVYIFVGVFGYIAFCNQPFTGNILMSFTPSIVTDAMIIGFVLSLAFSFPLIIFPCRASLYSLLYKQIYSFHEGISNYIPEAKFKFLTFIIVFASLVTGVLIPNIELVLGLVGSTIGIMICIVFPATCFICMSMKNTNERLAAQGMLFIGIIIMVLGTYANLYAIEEAAASPTSQVIQVQEPDILKIVKEDTVLRDNAIDIPTVKIPEKEGKDSNANMNQEKERNQVVNIVNENPVPLKEIRQEPPQPVEPEEVPKEVPQQVQILQKGPSVDVASINNLEQHNKSGANLNNENVDHNNIKIEGRLQEEAKNANGDNSQNKSPENVILSKEKRDKNDIIPNANIGRKDEVDIDAIKKEDKELMDQEREKQAIEEQKKLDILKTLEKQHEVQQQLLEQQKELLGQIKQQNLNEEQKQSEIEKVNREKLKAVKQIENIAKKAIESLAVDTPNVGNKIAGDVDKKEIDTDKNDVISGKKDQMQEEDKSLQDSVHNIQEEDRNSKNQIPKEDGKLKESLLQKDQAPNIVASNEDSNKVRQGNLTEKRNIIAMPLVNSDIYKNASKKGIISLFNRTNVKKTRNERQKELLDDMKNNNIQKHVKISETLKDTYKPTNEVKAENNLQRNSVNAQTDLKDLELPLKREKRTINNKEVEDSEKACEKVSGDEQQQDKVNTGTEVNLKPVDIGSKLSQFSNLDLIAKDLQKELNILKLQKKK